MPQVSVIIPVYNAEKYLRECLDSVTKQTLKDIEIICIDDGSKDNSAKVLAEYAAKDTRIILLTQNNKGAGAARNYGMKIAKGKYLSFLDSDDFFEPSLLADAVYHADHKQADIVIYKFAKFDNENRAYTSAEYAFHKEYWPERVFNYRDNRDKIFNSFNPSAWNKLFKAEFVKKQSLQFQENKRTNDLFFTCTALASADRIALLDKVLVYYRVNTKTSSQDTNAEAPLDFFKALQELQKFLTERGLYAELKDSYADLVVSICIYNISANNFTDSMMVLDFLESDGFKILQLEPDKAKTVFSIFTENYTAFKFLNSIRRGLNNNSVHCLRKAELSFVPKVSVIIPVYNVEAYLQECLDSVVAQSLREVEIICVNDGSKDNSLAVLKKYAGKEKRITLITRDNGGLSAARNTGVNFANGEFLYFLDSDDKISPQALQELYSKAHGEELDVLYFDAESIFDSEKIENSNLSYKNYYKRPAVYAKPAGGRELFIKMFDNHDYRTSVPLQLIRRAFYEENSFSFLPGILHEDNLFTFQCMWKAKRAAHLAKSYFVRRVRGNSIMTGEQRFEHAYGYFKCAIKMAEFLSEDQFTEAERRQVQNLFKLLLSSSHNIYKKLDKNNKRVAVFLPPLEEILFQRLVVQENSILGFCQLVQADGLEKNRLSLHANWKRLRQCYKEHGLRVTLCKIKAKILSIV